MTILVSKASFQQLLKGLITKTIKKKSRRKLGVLQGKGKIEFRTDFKMTEEGFLGV
jgi:hypothetical protein